MIRFSRYILLYFLLSAVVLISGGYSLVRYGLRPAVDFTGGTLIELSGVAETPKEVIEEIEKTQNLHITTIQKTNSGTVVLRMKSEDSEKIPSFVDALSAKTGTNVASLRQETVGPILGKELLTKAAVAAALAMVTILFYVAYAFKNIKFGAAAVLALFHDLLVVLGVFSILGHMAGVEVDTLFVTAFLTTMSFSVHDTIVVFDRIRESAGRRDNIPFDVLCDQALTETIGRSTTNSLTIIFMLLALVLLGGETVRWFVVALLIGTISGTYSSPFVATPILILWDRWEKAKANRK